MKTHIFAQVLSISPFFAWGYAPHKNIRQQPSLTMKRQFFSNISDDNSVDNHQIDDTSPELLTSTSDVDAHMAKLRSKYPTSEADYLAAARARNAAKQASSDRTATDADWIQIAVEKKQAIGDIDDWDKSVSEAGNADSQILIPMNSEIGEDDEEEPKLMLF
jgi:hypothetical protein